MKIGKRYFGRVSHIYDGDKTTALCGKRRKTKKKVQDGGNYSCCPVCVDALIAEYYRINEQMLDAAERLAAISAISNYQKMWDIDIDDSNSKVISASYLGRRGSI